jgi:hypothetical protein
MFDSIAALVGLISTLMGGLAASDVLGKLITSLFRKTRLKIAGVEIEAESIDSLRAVTDPSRPSIVVAAPRSSYATRQIELRLKEASALMVSKERNATRYRWAAHCLTFGQVVVGGVLATSFAQQSKDQTMLSFFGVLVLIASLIKQAFHPEVSAQQASQKAAQLKTMIRGVQDRIAIIRSTMDPSKDEDPEPWVALLTQMSASMNAIELSEIVQLPPEPKKEDAKSQTAGRVIQ